MIGRPERNIHGPAGPCLTFQSVQHGTQGMSKRPLWEWQNKENGQFLWKEFKSNDIDLLEDARVSNTPSIILSSGFHIVGALRFSVSTASPLRLLLTQH